MRKLAITLAATMVIVLAGASASEARELGLIV
jgi:hypothetical protein